MKNILIITVNFQQTKSTMKLIDSIEKCNNDNIKLVIIDNKSTESSKKELLSILDKTNIKTELFFNDNNLFYWPAASKILNEHFLSKNNCPNRIIICNNDIVFSSNFFKKLSKYNENKFPVLGPKIVDSKKNDLNPFMKHPLSKFKIFYWDLYFRSYYIAKVLLFLSKIKSFFKRQSKISKYTKVYAVHGSIIVFSKTFFYKGGKLDDNFDLYCEELTTAEISKKIGCDIFYIPELEAIHNQHSTTQRINSKRVYAYAKYSYDYFKKEYLKS